jgi:hypothetical protein
VTILRPPAAPAPPPPAPPAAPAPVVLAAVKPSPLVRRVVVVALEPVAAAAPADSPRPAPPRPAVAAWPASTRDAWRCEIGWDSGYRLSRFQAVVWAPGERKGRVTERSEPFKWLFDAPPKPAEPAFVAAVAALDEALVAAGWRMLPPGVKWYARRYVWPGAGAPPAA